MPRRAEPSRSSGGAGGNLPGLAARLAAAGFVAADEEAAELAQAAGRLGVGLEELVERRLAGEPLAWITGSVTFCGAAVIVLPGVYVPRWQSEPLVSRAVGHLPQDGVAVDVCTGSGAIAAALKRSRPRARIVATELDEAALACARRNGVEVHAGDLLGPVPRARRARRRRRRRRPLRADGGARPAPRDTLTFESPLAYDGGADGGDLLRRVVRDAAPLLRPGGVLLLELGADQPEALGSDLVAAGFGHVTVLEDDDGDVRGIEARH